MRKIKKTDNIIRMDSSPTKKITRRKEWLKLFFITPDWLFLDQTWFSSERPIGKERQIEILPLISF